MTPESEAGMRWTSDPPTVEGWYWLVESNRKHRDAVVVLVTHHRTFLMVHFATGRKETVHYIDGSWYGPIAPPQEQA